MLLLITAVTLFQGGTYAAVPEEIVILKFISNRTKGHIISILRLYSSAHQTAGDRRMCASRLEDPVALMLTVSRTILQGFWLLILTAGSLTSRCVARTS